MKKTFVLVFVVVILFGLNLYFKTDDKVKNELTGEVVHYPFGGVEARYYGRKAIPIDDTLTVSFNRGNVTVFNYNDFYHEEGDCIIEMHGDIKKAPEVTIEDGFLKVIFDESENVEDIQIDLYLADSRQYEKIDVTLGSGKLFYCGLDTSEVSLVNQNGDVSVAFYHQGATKVNVNAEHCSMDVDVEKITEICWQTHCFACENWNVYDTCKHDGSGSVFCNHGAERCFYERVFSQNDAECQMNVFGARVSFFND
ncbi:MAG: hypothetical protein J6M02_03260 [Clostridia bacterium]|nr:hypothetical protein [Clostridia bacterium]